MASQSKRQAVTSRISSRPVILLVGTCKGGFILKSDTARKQWKISAPVMLGNIVNHMVSDPRAPKNMLMAVIARHLPHIYSVTAVATK